MPGPSAVLIESSFGMTKGDANTVLRAVSGFCLVSSASCRPSSSSSVSSPSYFFSFSISIMSSSVTSGDSCLVRLTSERAHMLMLVPESPSDDRFRDNAWSSPSVYCPSSSSMN